MKKFYFLFTFILFFYLQSFSQLAGVKQVPSDNYPDLQTIADSLNLYGVATGGVSFILASGSVFEADPIQFTGSGAADAPVFIGWDGSGSKPVVNFNGTSSAVDAGFMLKGVDYYTLEGIQIENPASNLEFGVFLTNFNSTDGAHYNTIRNVAITLDKLNPFQTEGIRVAPLVTASAFEGNNHHNKFYNNHIQNVMIGYVFDGANSTTALMSVGNEIGTEGEGVSLIEDIVMAGVLVDDQNGFSLSNTVIKDLERIGSGTTAPAAVSTISGNPSEPLTNEFIFYNNVIQNLSSSFTSVYGFYFSARKATYHIHRNKIHNITATGGGGNTADGIMVLGTDITANIYNNMVSAIAAPASALNGNAASRGISVRTFSQANVYYNTVLLDFEATNLSHHSAAFIIYNNNDPVQMRNNIFINKTSFPEGATGIGAAFYKRTPALDNVMAGTDNNIYYAGEPGPRNVIFYGHNSSAPAIDQTLFLYQFRAGTFDQNSFTEDVAFVAADDLHIVATEETQARGNASPVTEPVNITTDFDETMRDALNPDIGADEIAAPYPAAAVNPQPLDGQTEVSVELGVVSWEYFTGPEFIVPEAFLVYLNDTPDFTGVEPLETVLWENGLTAYSTSLPLLDYETTYYWKVVPTADINNGPETPDVAVWQFSTEVFVFPYPNTATEPSPSVDEVVDIDLIQLGWSFVPQANYTFPAGFKVYLSEDENITSDDLLAWVQFAEGQVIYEAALAGFELEYASTYFWKVVPTVDKNNGPDAEGVETWSFTTVLIPWPNLAQNPIPEDEGIQYMGDVQYIQFGWEFVPQSNHQLPTHFLLYGAADTNAAIWSEPIMEIAYQEGQTNYSVELIDHPNFNYIYFVDNFWKVVPVAEGDQGVPPSVAAWSFHFEEYVGLKEQQDIQVKLYPNPAQDVVSIEPAFSGSYDLMVYDLSGRLMAQYQSVEGIHTVVLNGWKSGTYQFVIRQGNQQQQKLIEVLK
jgi:hypothetical protein